MINFLLIFCDPFVLISAIFWPLSALLVSYSLSFLSVEIKQGFNSVIKFIAKKVCVGIGILYLYHYGHYVIQ